MSIKRLFADFQQVTAANLERDGIYCSYDEDNVYNVRVMICGPTDTPYADGFYFFHLEFPPNYPHAPPKATYETRYNTVGNRIRFNPNLYASGKVCVSLLGTWNGPQWDSCQSLYSVLLALQTLLVDDPLCNEPGYVTRPPNKAPKHDRYQRMIAFENVRVATLRMLQHPPNGFEAFVPVMQQWFAKRADAIAARLEPLVTAHPDTEELECTVYRFRSTIDYPRVWHQFQTVRATLLSLYPDLDKAVEAEVGADPDPDPGPDPDTSVEADTVAATETATSDDVHDAPDATTDATASLVQDVEALGIDTSVNELVTAAVTAYAAATHTVAVIPAATSPPTKPKRARPSAKASASPYALEDVVQPNGTTVQYQSVPHTYTVKEVPHTRWSWHPRKAGEAVAVPPASAEVVL